MTTNKIEKDEKSVVLSIFKKVKEHLGLLASFAGFLTIFVIAAFNLGRYSAQEEISNLKVVKDGLQQQFDRVLGIRML